MTVHGKRPAFSKLTRATMQGVCMKKDRRNTSAPPPMSQLCYGVHQGSNAFYGDAYLIILLQREI